QTALQLADDHRFQVTLLSEHADFYYYPSLFRTATGGRRYIASLPLQEIFKDKNVHLIQDTVTELDRKAQTINTSVGHFLRYNALVLALGVKTNYFHIKGLEEFSYSVKSPDDADRFKRHIHQQMVEDHKMDLNYVVVGGGPTGVELAGALPSYIKQVAA